METKRLAEWLGSADGLIKTIAALLASAGVLAAAITDQFKPILEWFGLPEIARQIAAPIATIAILGAVILLFRGAYRRYAQGSPGNFPPVEPVNPQTAEPTAWLTIKGVTIFGHAENVYVRVIATVNGVEYIYPSLSGVKWLEAGPEMAPQTFQIPVRDTYRIRLTATLRDPIGRSTDLASVEEQRVTGKTNGIAVYDLRFVKWEARFAAPSVQVRYTISQGAP
jgi:hypothetical protein